MLIAYNVMLGCPTLHWVKAMIASYLLQIQYEAGDGVVDNLFGDERTGCECNPVSIRPLARKEKASSSAEKPWAQGSISTKALVIYAM